ncbi:MAG: substrate-binding domain-containing protein [Marinobacterium sp.]|nr:substrate-binding domain-containing protein [Marinobacterium sp.]
MLLSPVVQAGKQADYWTYDEYYRLHPEQQAVSGALIDAVRKAAIPLRYDGRPVRVGIIYPSFQFSNYWPRSVKSFELRMQELNIPYELRTRYTRPNTEVSMQVRQIEEMLAWQPDYLVYTLDSPRQRMVVERLVRGSNIKVILQNITTPVKEWGKDQPFMYIGFDHAEGARILARYLRKRLSAGTEYGVVFRSKGFISDMRGLTYIHAVDGFHNLSASYYTDSSRKGGYEAAHKIVKDNPQISYIYATSTDTALGTVDALAELGRTDIIVNGWGGGAEEIAELRKGNLQVVLMRMNDGNGVAMAEGIRRDLQGLPVPLIFSGDFIVLDDRMSAQQISDLEASAFRYSDRQQE